MKSYDELKAEMESIQHRMDETKKKGPTNALNKVKWICKELGSNAGMLKGSFFEVRKKEWTCL